MVLVGDKKYACETCIKGHRSSTCKHTDRPLYEIKKKGRPVTQCEHCRELRKTKQVHVKCMCGALEQKDATPESDAAPSTSAVTNPVTYLKKKGGKKVPASAAFPSGLPPALGASVALSEGSDSEHGLEQPSQTCMCKNTGVCNCFTPRVSTSRPKQRRPSKTAKTMPVHREADSDSDTPRMNQPAALVASAHIPGKRPVLPRPAPSERSSPPRNTHSPSGTSASRTHPSSFSPYERAYDYAHGAEVGGELPPSLYAGMQHPQGQMSPNPNPAPDGSFSTPSANSPREMPEDLSAYMNAWLTALNQQQGSDTPVTCDCGPNCACSGCVLHQPMPSVNQNGQACVNPATCSSCMDCVMLSVTQDNPAIEEWFRRFSSNTSNVPPPSPIPGLQLSPLMNNFMPSQEQHQPFDPSMWQTYALWPNLQNQTPVAPPAEDSAGACCAGQCKCPSGQCSCPSDCCGCCSGCACAECVHEDRSMGTGKTLTFAVSGERAPCCSGARPAIADMRLDMTYSQQSQPGPSNPVGRSVSHLDQQQQLGFDFSGQQLDLRGTYDWSASGSSMDVPRVSLSRASSTSSRSSSQHSHSSRGSIHRNSASPNPSGMGGASNNIDNHAVRSCCTGIDAISTQSTAGSVASSLPNSPIPPSFSPSPLPNEDHRTFASSSSSLPRSQPHGADTGYRTFF